MASASTSTASATPDSIEWTEDRALQLIKEYRDRPLLWYRNSPYYFKRQMKQDAWEEIGKVLKIPTATCKHKMNIILSSYRREKAKAKYKGRKNPYKSNWFAFEKLSFFKENDTDETFSYDIMKETEERYVYRNKKKDGTEKDGTETDDQTYNSEMEYVDETEAETILPTVTPIIQQIEPSKLSKLELPTVSQMHVREGILPTFEGEEEINSFATFIAMKMKKFTQKTKNTVQKEICDIIFKADQGFYEQTDYGSHNNVYNDVRRIDADQPHLKNETVAKNSFSDDE